MQNQNEKKEKNWILKSTDTPELAEKVSKIASALGINPVVARLLYNRGYKDEAAAKSFIYMESEMLSDPFRMKDVEAAIDGIKDAVARGEKITVYGDYDVDGVTSVCTLYLYLKSLGASVEYYIPNRAGEGYGVSTQAIDAIKENGTGLIITVDTGTTAIEEVEYAKSLGIRFIVTDHHECHAALPEAMAVVNPRRPDCDYPFKELAGVGVVFKLICAYEERVFGKSRIDAAKKIFSEYADLVAIGTIADVMPIKEENRIIVKYGLDMIERTSRVGLAALIEASSAKTEVQRTGTRKKKTKITSGYIGYTIAPRINAAGRIKTASMAVELFLCEDKSRALIIAEELCKTNKERQSEENKIMREAYQKIEKYDIDENPVIVLDADNWHHGVIGIVASRITEKYARPAILVSFEGNESGTPSPDDIGKGSGRSIKGMNLVDALCHCSEHLVKFGGHELAAGLSVTRGELDNFRCLINDYARSMLTEKDMVQTVEADCELDFGELNLSLAKSIQLLEPYGVSNPIPVFIMRGVTVAEISGISDGKHTRLALGNGRYNISAMYFSNSPESLGIYVGDKVDVLFNLDINEWAGRENVQLIVRDLKPSKQEAEQTQALRERFEEIKNGAHFTAEEDVLPSREDFAAVYRFMLATLRSGSDTLTHKKILSKFRNGDDGVYIGYVKLKIIVMVMKELNIANIEDVSEEVYRFNIQYKTTKTELDKSTLLRRLRSQLIR
ncbi:MAG: single-stranded-DNA-specific exonuclease RecJ [Ruminococcaceae bacterium]|nr:single-stranded-DNA-specific exonuclease RecJ [Oscillospiraceae bacterium]